MKHIFTLLSIILFIFITTLPGQTWDGYILSGDTWSYTHYNQMSDFLVYKVGLTGAKQWRKNYGGSRGEYIGYIQQTADGGYILTGYTGSYFHGENFWTDLLVYKLDSTGQKQWRKNYGGILGEQGGHIQQTADGGFILAGNTKSFTHGEYDLLVYKLDANGHKQWRKNYGGSKNEYNGRVMPTADGGYILSGYGYSYSHGGGDTDLLIYKLDANGLKQWRKNFGGSGNETGMYIRQTSDGGYILAGRTNSYTNGGYDILVYKLNASGTKQWRQNYGGPDIEYSGNIEQTSEGGYIFSGRTEVYHNGHYDMIAYKLDSAGSKLWSKTYGGTGWEYEGYIQQTNDNGYILGGFGKSYTNGESDFLIYKLDATGTEQWRKNYGGVENDQLRVVEPTYH